MDFGKQFDKFQLIEQTATRTSPKKTGLCVGSGKHFHEAISPAGIASVQNIFRFRQQHSYVGIPLIVLSIMSSNGAATMLWSRYCPGLRNTGIVSDVTGFLDFLSYMAAATANIVFPFLIEKQNWPWDRVVLILLGLMVVGVTISLPWKKWMQARKEA